MQHLSLVSGLLASALALAGCAAPTATAGTFFVSPTGRDSNRGTEESPWSLAKANAAAKPGDTVVLLDGTYETTPVAPARSGVEGKPIIYKAARAGRAVLTNCGAMPGPFPDDDSGSPAAIFLLNRSHIVVDGIAVKDPGGRFLYAGGASYVTVENCDFENSEYPIPWESCRFKLVGDGIIFRNNRIRKGNDSVAITGGSHHLIEGNTFEGASHTCLVLMGVRDSVVRGNKLTNPIQKLMEVFTARHRDVGDEIRKSEHVVIEGNTFGPAPLVEENGTRSGSGSAGIQYAGNRCILRRNVFVKCGMGMDFSRYSAGHRDDPEALWCSGNRFYNNTIYDCGWQARYGSGPGIWISAGDGVEDNVLMNNILYRNRAYPDAHFPPNTPPDVQLAYADASQFRLIGNLLMGTREGEVTIWNKADDTGFKLREFEARYPGTARGNLEAEPSFVDAEAGDFRLGSGSPCIDAGVALTSACSAGQGSVIEVEDAGFFCDGFGIVEPDVLRVGTERVKALKVDYGANTITLDRGISWKQGDPVTLDHAGKELDIGAIESSGRSSE
ncbi:MAG: nitrous oxide reductase family maturation protein NosD [Armatimonadota bacterium]